MAIKSIYSMSMKVPEDMRFAIGCYDKHHAGVALLGAKDIKNTLLSVSSLLKAGFCEVDVYKAGSDGIHTITSLDDLEELKKRLLED